MAAESLRVEVRWLEGKRIEVAARGNRLIVDEIYADGREGAGFRPTELLLAALGACTMGTVLTFCRNTGIALESFEIAVEGKREKAPERVGEIGLALRLAGAVPPERVATLERVARGCRIHYTLAHPPHIGLALEVEHKQAASSGG